MLLIDCGNSSLKAQHRVDDRVCASFACRYHDRWLPELMRWAEAMPAQRAYLASVADAERVARLGSRLQDRFGDRFTRLVSAASACGVNNAYAQPERLGVDRWLALLGARGLCAGDCMIIDAGSAITLDLLRADGQHLGGAILAGTHTSRERFRQIFSHIDFDDARIREDAAPGCSTEAAIQINYAENSLSRLSALVNRWSQNLNQNFDILVAGGDAAAVQRALARPCRIRPDLVFDGIARLVQA